MEFDYHPIQIVDSSGQDKMIQRPLVELTLSKRGTKPFQALGLLDSGADIIIFPLHIADYLEVQYKKCKKIDILVAGGSVTTAYSVPFDTHKIQIMVAGKTIKTTIDFCDGQTCPLLGQTFFEHFNITFKRRKKKFILK